MASPLEDYLTGLTGSSTWTGTGRTDLKLSSVADCQALTWQPVLNCIHIQWMTILSKKKCSSTKYFRQVFLRAVNIIWHWQAQIHKLAKYKLKHCAHAWRSKYIRIQNNTKSSIKETRILCRLLSASLRLRFEATMACAAYESNFPHVTENNSSNIRDKYQRKYLLLPKCFVLFFVEM